MTAVRGNESVGQIASGVGEMGRTSESGQDVPIRDLLSVRSTPRDSQPTGHSAARPRRSTPRPYSRAAQAGILTLADKGYQGAEATAVITPYKDKNKPDSQKQANRSHAILRGPGERANAQLKSWRILRKLRCSPTKTGHLVKAIAVLQNHRVAHATRG
jgi:hypothetical protein